jgi:hypothetical protein
MRSQLTGWRGEPPEGPRRATHSRGDPSRAVDERVDAGTTDAHIGDRRAPVDEVIALATTQLIRPTGAVKLIVAAVAFGIVGARAGENVVVQITPIQLVITVTAADVLGLGVRAEHDRVVGRWQRPC